MSCVPRSLEAVLTQVCRQLPAGKTSPHEEPNQTCSPPRPQVTCHLAVRGPQPSSWLAALTGAHLLRKSVAWINRACSASHSHPSLAGRKPWASGCGLHALSITFHSNPATAGCCSSAKLPWEWGSDKRKKELVLVGLGPLPVTSESLLGPRPLPPPSASLPPPTPLMPSESHLSFSPPGRHHGLMTQHPA